MRQQETRRWRRHPVRVKGRSETDAGMVFGGSMVLPGMDAGHVRDLPNLFVTAPINDTHV